MADPKKKIKKLDSRMRTIVRRINSMSNSFFNRSASRKIGDAFGFDSSFSDFEEMIDAIDEHKLKGDPSNTEKLKLKKEKQRLKKVTRQKQSLLKSLKGGGGGGMYSPSKPLKDQSLLSMAKKRQM